MAAGRDVKDAIVKEISTAKVDPMELDLSSLAYICEEICIGFQFLGPSLEPLNVRKNKEPYW
jgi:hypothetical protein